MAEQSYFDERDVDLLVDVISLVPNLGEVAHAAKLARGRAKYPIEGYDGLAALLDDGRSARFGDREVTLDDVHRFFPKEFFPVDSEQDLIAKLLIAFQRGEVEHLKEKVPMPRRKPTIAPSPRLSQ
jgi:hypothetical protein